MGVSIVFYDGVNQIGGNKILIQDNDTKILLDFGKNYKKYKELFSEYLSPRTGNGLRDYFRMELLPYIRGIYRNDVLKHSGFKEEEIDLEGVLVTHAHTDHITHIEMLNPEIPVFVSRETKKIMELSDLFSNTELISTSPKFNFYKTKTGKIGRVTARNEMIQRKINELDYEKPFKIDDIKITPYQVDHSLPGATAYIIETSESVLVYTGDYRLSGRNSEKTKRFMEKVSELKPEILITEGTRIMETEKRTENMVEIQGKSAVSNTDGLVLADYPPRDLDRIITFNNIAKQNDRQLVVDFRQAIFLKEMEKFNPNIKLNDVLVYEMPRSWFMINQEGALREQIEGDYRKWEISILERGNTISTDEIKRNPKKFVFFLPSYFIGNLIDLEPSPESIFIHSKSDPFDEEGEFLAEKTSRWLDEFRINKRFNMHCSGHANGAEIFEFLRNSSAKNIIPVHTENPEIFKLSSLNITLPTRLNKYFFENGVLLDIPPIPIIDNNPFVPRW